MPLNHHHLTVVKNGKSGEIDIKTLLHLLNLLLLNSISTTINRLISSEILYGFKISSYDVSLNIYDNIFLKVR